MVSGFVVLVFRGPAETVHDLTAGAFQLGGALPDQLLQPGVVGVVFADQAGLLHGLGQRVFQNAHAGHGFGQKIPGPGAHGLQGVLNHAHAGQNDDRQFRGLDRGLLQKSVSVQDRHVQIDNDGAQFRQTFTQDFQAFETVGGGQRVVIQIFKIRAQGAPQTGFVIDDKNGVHWFFPY